MELKVKSKKHANSLWAIILPLIVFIILGVFIYIERSGLILSNKVQPVTYSFLPAEKMIPRSERELDKRSLVIFNSTEEYSSISIPNITFVLDQMSVGFTLVDISETTELPPFSEYKTVVIACAELMPIMLSLPDLFEWVKAGGGLLYTQTPEDDWFVLYFHEELGLEPDWENELDLVPQLTAHLETDLFVGGRGTTIPWSGDTEEEYRYGGKFLLSKSSIMHMSSSGPEGSTPMLWEKKTGKGKVVVNNNDAMWEKWSRGLVAAAYSLTESAVAYPVINASVFFIDDFPAPVPQGFDPYIKSEYNVQSEYYFVNIWFPDMLRLSNKHKIKYTGLFILSYNDNVYPPFLPEMPAVTERMKYFGSLFLNEGYEMGFHGYNHQSLVMQNFDYKDFLPYNKWPGPEAAADALKVSVGIQQELFPNTIMKTYVPPSNVLSVEGRAMLKQYFPEINVISGLLVDDFYDLDDDFGIGEDGIINMPRISSGYYPFDDREDDLAFWFILNEIHLHFMNSHFIHPDDIMDPDRGAIRGWKSMYDTFDEFLTWLDKYNIRNMTAQEAAPAIQKFENLNVHTTLTDRDIVIDLEGFYDEAYLLVRINEGTPLQTRGGSLTKVGGTLYLLKADAAHISINLDRPRI